MRRVKDINEVKPGDYVLCTKYTDRDPNDQWQVGFLESVESVRGALLFRLKNPMRSYFKCCWLITRDEGKRILDQQTPKAARSNGQPKNG